MKVVLAESVYAELAQIGREIKKDNPARAATFVSELHDRCRKLGYMPRAFPLLPNREEQGIRRWPYGDYLISYRIEDSTVQVLHVLHGAMDYERTLFPED